MNQILLTYNITKKQNTKKIKQYIYVIFFSFSTIIICIIAYLFFQIDLYKKEQLSKKYINNFSISKLYSNNNTTNISFNNNDKENTNFVIGIIKIPKIDIIYPILSTTTDELLKISPCKFYGPFPNEIGNLCIAGHNYANKKIFGNLNKLNIEDTFILYDLSGNQIEYIIYNKYQTTVNDISCLNQKTYGKKEVTLITCNNINGNRLIIKAKEKI